MVERATPHTRQTRARPYGYPVEGEVAWLIVSTSWVIKGVGLQLANLFTQQLNFRGRFTQLFVQRVALRAGALAST
jgi:hypothetical protein